MEYEDYLKLWAIIMGDKEEGMHAVYLPVIGYHGRKLIRMDRGQFVKRLTEYEEAVTSVIATREAGDVDEYEAAGWEVTYVSIELFMSYWEQMGDAGLRLVL